LRVKVSGFEVLGLGFRVGVWGSRFRVQGLGLEAKSFRISGSRKV
jgi:hypothetical protein